MKKVEAARTKSSSEVKFPIVLNIRILKKKIATATTIYFTKVITLLCLTMLKS